MSSLPVFVTFITNIILKVMGPWCGMPPVALAVAFSVREPAWIVSTGSKSYGGVSLAGTGSIGLEGGMYVRK
jgi:hypothetical protein